MYTRNEIKEKLGVFRESDIVIGFTASSFDLGPHIGHCLMLQEAAENCDWLIVALMTNPQNDRPEKNKPIQTIFERFIQLQSNKYIDEIIIIDTEMDLLNALIIIQPDIRFVGEEYKGTKHTGYNLGQNIHYNKRSHNYSSEELISRLKLRGEEK